MNDSIRLWLLDQTSCSLKHARWLNTLSYLENCGARMIALSEHPTMVSREILKHAAEEFRHAYYLKSLIHHVYAPGLPNYARHHLMEAAGVRHYMDRLNTRICRLLKRKYGRSGDELKQWAYLMVTYAVEVRALQIYTVYEEILRQQDAPISVRGILREEKGHLQEIEQECAGLEGAKPVQQEVVKIEAALFACCLHIEPAVDPITVDGNSAAPLAASSPAIAHRARRPDA